MRFGRQVETYEALGDKNAFDRMLAVARLAEAEGFESAWYEITSRSRMKMTPTPPGPSSSA